MNREYLRSPFVVLAAILVPAVAAAQYQIVTTSTTRVGPLERTEWVVAPSLDPIETFEMTRWARRGPGAPARGAVLFLPSLGTTDRRLLVEPDFGHVDHFMSPRHKQLVELPILRWLRQVFD